QKTSSETSNLDHGVEACDQQHEIKKDGTATIGSQPTMHESVSKYTPYWHCALIALHCVKDNWPFESVKDEFYCAELELLHLGTKLPDPTTISQDVNKIYIQVLQDVKVYFQVSSRLSTCW
ncbi:hypothetical protein K439DRAFT_1366513, partial [Ramaria rubella]